MFDVHHIGMYVFLLNMFIIVVPMIAIMNLGDINKPTTIDTFCKFLLMSVALMGLPLIFVEFLWQYAYSDKHVIMLMLALIISVVTAGIALLRNSNMRKRDDFNFVLMIPSFMIVTGVVTKAAMIIFI